MVRSSNLKLRVIVHGYFGFGNVGDETVLSVVLDEFRMMFGDDVEFVVLSSIPGRTVRIHGIRAIRGRLTSPVFWRFFLRSHVLVFAGGGRYGYATWREMALLALLAELLGKAVVFWAVGVYPYDWRGSPVISREPVPFRGLTGLLIRFVVSRASYVSVRDGYSYTVLRMTGVNRRIVIENDLAFRMKPPGLSECASLAVKYGIAEGKVLGINLRTLDNETNRRIVDYVVRLVREFMGRGFDKIVFVPFGFGSFEGRFFDDDLIIANMLKKYVPNLVVINEELNPRTIFCLFNYFDYLIVMRHHAIIFALLTNKPMTALVYDTKSFELLRASDKSKNINMVLIHELI
jgi:polysaccharide pyruvyl transferase WcaK-like protein